MQVSAYIYRAMGKGNLSWIAFHGFDIFQVLNNITQFDYLILFLSFSNAPKQQ